MVVVVVVVVVVVMVDNDHITSYTKMRKVRGLDKLDR